MIDPNSKVVLTAKLKGILDRTSSQATVHEDGHVELDYFDFSSDAHAHFGNDIACVYRIDASHKPRLRELLAAHARTTVADDQSMLETIARSFGDVKVVKDWLAKNQLPFEEEFDSWA